MKLIGEIGSLNKNRQSIPVFKVNCTNIFIVNIYLLDYVPNNLIDKKDWAQLITEKYKNFP